MSANGCQNEVVTVLVGSSAMAMRLTVDARGRSAASNSAAPACAGSAHAMRRTGAITCGMFQRSCVFTGVSPDSTTLSEMAVATEGVLGEGISQEYERHRRRALRLLERHFPDVEPDERLSLYHDAWSSVLRRQAAGTPVDDLEAYLIGAVKLAARHRRRTAASRRTEPKDPHGELLGSVADTGPSVHERVATGIDAALCREIIASLDGRARDVIKLRFDCGFEVEEVRALLGISERAYVRTLERARAAIADRVAEVHDGSRDRRHRSLLVACELGIASARQRARARRLIAESPGVRAMAGELRGLPREAAALLPLPALPTVADQPLTSVFDAAKQAALNLLGRFGSDAPAQVAAAGGVRGGGTVAAAVAACVAAGGAASYCAVEGVPEPIRQLTGVQAERPARTGQEPRRNRLPAASATPAATSPAQPAREIRPAPTPQSSDPRRSRPEAQPEPPTAPPQAVALGFERSRSAGSVDPAPQSQPAPAVTTGEFGQP